MAIYAFSMPILPGKTEDLKRYLNEMTGPRMRDYDRSCQKQGLRSEHMFIQHIPQGNSPDMLLIVWDVDDPMRMFQQGLDPNDSFENWFMDKVMVGCLGVKADQMKPDQMPPLNQHIVNYTMGAGEKERVQTGKR